MTRGRLTVAVLGYCLALFAMMGANLALAKENMPTPASFFKNDQAQTRYMEYLIRAEFGDQPKVAALMVTIAMCESGDIHSHTIRQWDTDGDILPIYHHVNDAAGAFQVRLELFQPVYEKLGLDIKNNAIDYISFVHYLYETYGLSPWTASRGCWKQHYLQIARE